MADQITASLAQAKVLVMEGQKGEGGVSPSVTFEPITVGGRTGNKMTVTDADHPSGQSINILNGKDGEGGGSAITVDDALSSTSENPVQNKVINAALQSKGTYSKPSGGIPETDLASDVQTSLGKADGAIQNPSGGSAGDFLRKTASGVAWQAVPSAESNSFGGGS